MYAPAGRLRGSYHVVAQYTDPAGTPQQITSDFAATVHQSLFERGRLFFDRHRSLIILVVVLIVAAGLAARLLRRQRRLEAELRQVKAERDRDPSAS